MPNRRRTGLVRSETGNPRPAGPSARDRGFSSLLPPRLMHRGEFTGLWGIEARLNDLSPPLCRRKTMTLATTAASTARSPFRHVPVLAGALAVVAAVLLALGPIGWRAGWWHFR